MSVKRNMVANYASHFYITLTGIMMVPLYIKYMGAEAYGLVGFFAMLQAWFMLLDMGLTPTLARETARLHGGATDPETYRRLTNTLECVFLFLGMCGGAVLFFSSSYIARDWLHASALPVQDVQAALELMAIAIAMRWMSGLYRGVISGSERLVWLGTYDGLIATMRYVVVLPVFIFVGTTPQIFFGYQLLVAAIELCGLWFCACRIFPSRSIHQPLGPNWSSLKRVSRFALTIAFTSSIWISITQTDKLVLSKILPLAEYGYFSLAVLVASGVIVLCSPLSRVIMPRMSRLEAQRDAASLIRIYRQSTQLAALLAGSASVTIGFVAEPLLWVWTGDKFLAQQAAPILVLYALGNGILAVAAFPYYLQYAKGNLQMHLIGHVGFILVLLPTLIWAAYRFGGVGAGYVWVATNLLFFFGWLPLVHRRMVPGLNAKWYLEDVLIIFVSAALVGFTSARLLPHGESRWSQLVYIVGIGISVCLASAMASSEIRFRLRQWAVATTKSEA